MAENNQTANPFLSETEIKKPPVAPLTSPGTSRNTPPVTSTAKKPSTEPINLTGPKFETSKPFLPETGTRRKHWVRWSIGVVLILLIAFGVYRWWQRTQPPQEEVAQETPTPQVTSPTPIVTEEAPLELLDDTANYHSENYKAGEIVFLGEAQFLMSDEGVAPLTLDSIRGEAFTEKNKKEVKLVITWKTNKLSSAEIGYAKGIGQTPKTVTEDDYAYNHSMILTGLDPASTYLYTVKATDRFGNVVTSEPYAVFTGARSVSLFDLIAGAIGDVFGWAVK